MNKQEADVLYEGSPVTYLFGLGDGSVVIDGHGLAMFINHSCDPNCETTEVRGRVWIEAIRDIAPGEEITYDYCLYDGGDEEAPCNCGTIHCRGTMYVSNGNGHKPEPEPIKKPRHGKKRAVDGRAIKPNGAA